MTVFQGYCNETFEFFMAIRFNNNRPFFQENRDWYLRAVRQPSLDLAQYLGAVVEEIDPELERRPHRVVSRINRDIRFSLDKSPYRDCVWLAFRRPGEERHGTLALYFDLQEAGASYGMGFYRENRGTMNALRSRLAQNPEEFLKLWQPLQGEFVLFPQTIKRIQLPAELPEPLVPWYTARGFYLEKPIANFDLIRSSGLAQEIESGFRRLQKLYQYLLALQDR